MELLIGGNLGFLVDGVGGSTPSLSAAAAAAESHSAALMFVSTSAPFCCNGRRPQHFGAAGCKTVPHSTFLTDDVTVSSHIGASNSCI